MTRARGAARRPRLLIVCLLVAGCAAAAPPRLPLLPDAPAARLAAVREREAMVRTLRARFRSTVRLPSGERGTDGVLLIAKPDRFRMRLLLPLGITVYDHLSVGARTWTALPLADAAQRERLDEFAPFSRDDLAQVFLRGADAFPGDCVAAAGEPVVVRCGGGAAAPRTLSLGAEGIVEETSYDAAGAARLTIRYADYRAVGDAVLPFHIVLEYPQRGQSVEIAVDRYDVNPPLSDALFAPPADAAGSVSLRVRASLVKIV